MGERRAASYPLLTRSVARLEPAGIPGVESIELHERFRIVATVNDASIEDIVFPISEGLARRFVRIEMPGGERDRGDLVCLRGALRRRAARDRGGRGGDPGCPGRARGGLPGRESAPRDVAAGTGNERQ